VDVASGAILNGGRASRFGGRDKGALIVEGRTVRDRLVAVLTQALDEVMIVGGRTDDVAWPAGVRRVDDLVPDHGPLGGLQAALDAASCEVVLVVACDMPGVTAPFVRYLVAAADNVDAVVPRTESGYHPLCAVYRRTVLSVVSRHLAAGRLALRDLLTEVRVREVTETELAAIGHPAALLANLNTPDDYRALLNHES
jgi:molybdenum cofactor guanylyltransferase